VGEGFVEGALPEFGIGVGVPLESSGGEVGAAEAEDADLLSGEGGEGVSADGRGEEAVVGVHGGLEVKVAVIARHEGNVAEGVVFAAARAAEVGD